MPVVSLTLVAVAALTLAPLMLHAQSRVLIKHAYQLERAPAVAKVGRDYAALAGAYVLYDQCSAELAITEQEKTYLAEKFTKIAREYQITYQDAYVGYVGSSPKQALVDDIAASIKQQQQKAVNGMASALRKWGCADSRFRKIRAYVDALRAADNAAPADPTLREPKAPFKKKP